MAQRKWLNYNDYQRSLEQIAADLPPVIIVEGEEEYLRQVALGYLEKRIIEEYPQAAVVQFYGPVVQGEGRFDFAGLLTELGSASLFAAEKIITFRSAQRSLFASGAGETSSRKISPLQSLAEYMQNPSENNYLLLEVEKINRQRIIGKVMAKAAIIPCPILSRQSDVIAWMKNEARGQNKELDIDAAGVLYRAHGGDLGVLSSEIVKLGLYTGDERHITADAVKQFLSGTVEFSIFELISALERRDLAAALEYVRLICEQGSRDQSGKRQDGLTSAHQALALVSSLLENLLSARAMLAEELAGDMISSELGLHPRRSESIIAAARNFTLEELQSALSTLALEMKSAHDTGADPKLSLERIAITVCSRQRRYSG